MGFLAGAWKLLGFLASGFVKGVADIFKWLLDNPLVLVGLIAAAAGGLSTRYYLNAQHEADVQAIHKSYKDAEDKRKVGIDKKRTESEAASTDEADRVSKENRLLQEQLDHQTVEYRKKLGAERTAWQAKVDAARKAGNTVELEPLKMAPGDCAFSSSFVTTVSEYEKGFAK